MTGETLLGFVDATLFPALKVLSAGGRTKALAAVIRGVFEDAYNYMKSGTLMRQVINKLNEIDFNRSADRHQFGEIYEKLLSDLQNAGNAGEYYTPRAVTQFAVDMVAPKLDEKILDPACGTGGFLTCANSSTCASTTRRTGPRGRGCSRASGGSRRSRCRTCCA